jgi:D-alanyl-D-alanine dipeptidase
VRIEECGEPLVPFLEVCPRLYWVPRHPVFAYERFRLVRAGVAARLSTAAGALPRSTRLAVVEGYRAPAIQAQMNAASRDRVLREHPDWPANQISRKVNRFSAPMDPRVPPPHTTGGAIDVHLVDEHGTPMDMQSPFDMLDLRAAAFEVRGLSEAAQRNRALLAAAMGLAGFTNYPAEWWHWSFGDPGWAYRGGHRAAFYGAIEPEGLETTDMTFRLHDAPGW